MDTATILTQVGTPIALAMALAVGFGLALRTELMWRAALLAVLTAAILLLPLMVPAEYPIHRAAVVFVCVFTVLKLFDVHLATKIECAPSWTAYLAFVVHPFTLVQRKLADELQPPLRRNLVCLVRGLAVSLAGLAGCLRVWRVDFTNVPFALEHVVKTIVLMALVYGVTEVITSVWRLLGGRARSHLHNFFLARTPADFWRRYSRVIGQFLYEDWFKRVGGRRAPVRATLIVFAISGLMHEYAFGIAAERVQGWQMAFFMVQGLAVAATQRIKPTGPRTMLLWTVGTFAFNLATSVLFFTSLNQIWPFWSARP